MKANRFTRFSIGLLLLVFGGPDDADLQQLLEAHVRHVRRRRCVQGHDACQT